MLKMLRAYLGWHLQLQLQQKGMRCAAESDLRAGAESRRGSPGGRAPHLGPCAAFGWGDAWGSPSWKAQRKVLVKEEALPCFLFALQPSQRNNIRS